MSVEDIFKAGDNCWVVKKARRVALLVDGESYFAALHQAMRQATQTIIIVGWDVHSELSLVRNGENGDYPSTLGKFLDYLARTTKGLQIYLLSWDFAMIYAMEREFFPRYKLKWQTHRNIHFCLDGRHPVGASQHQKVVVIDDAVAFSGGLDLSKWRWDTSDHLPKNEQRVDPDGKKYPPFHDVQMLVDGPAAAALGELVRERWQRACEVLPVSVDPDKVTDPWPIGVHPDFSDTAVAISRTFPRYGRYAEIREVEKLYLDSIAAARSSIYLENQYLSSYRIGEAIKKRLAEDDGPEIVMVLPLKTGGWLEQHTMDVLRNRILSSLRKADIHNRLRVYYARLSVEPEINLMVHDKVMVIDGCFVRIGSSNLSNRSLGLDSECDLSLVGAPDSATADGVASFRNRLLAEHLAVTGDDVAEALRQHGSLIATIESLQAGDRTLVPLEGKIDQELDQWVPESELLDPEQPLEPEAFFDYLIHPEYQRPAYRQFIKIFLIIAAVLGLAALWRWTPLGQWLNLDTVTASAQWLKGHPFSPLLVPLTYVVLGLVSFPVTLMIMATIIVYGPWWGSVYALIGTGLSAMALFFLGHMLGKSTVSRFSGSLINRVNERLSKSGLVAVITFRIIPVAPFSLINLVAGVSAISLRDFIIGTLIGIIPGIVAIALVADRLSASLRQPDMSSFTALFGAVLVLGAGLVGLRTWLKRKKDQKTT